MACDLCLCGRGDRISSPFERQKLLPNVRAGRQLSPPLVSPEQELSDDDNADDREPLTRASRGSSSPIRRCRSLELRHIFAVRRDQSVDRPASRNESKHRPIKMFETVGAADFELATSASRLPSMPSAATLKAKLKGAFNRASVGVKGGNPVLRSGSRESVGHPKPEQPPAANGNEPSSVKTRTDGNKDRVPMARKELDSCLRYFQEVVRTGKVEMLAGSTTMILDSVLKLVNAFHVNAKGDDKTTYKRLYDAVVAILQLADTHVGASAAKQQEDDGAIDLVSEKEASNAMVEQLRSVVAELATSIAENRLSADSGNSSSVGGDQQQNGGRLTPPPRPPRPSKNKRPLSPDHKRKTSPPISADSGIFNDTTINISGQETRDSQLFSDTSLDDLLAQLNLTSNKVAKFAPEFPKIDQDDSDDDTTNDSGVLVDERREERSENHGSKICEEEVQETPDGRQIRTTKTRTVMKKQSSTQMTITTSGGGGDEVVRKFADGSNSFRDDSDFKIDRFGDFFGGVKGRPYSPYDNRPPSSADDDELRVDSPPPLPPRLNRPGALTTQQSEEGGAVVKRNRHVMQHSATLQSVARRATKNGKLVADDAAHKVDTQALKASQSDTFHEGELVDRQGGGAYEEQSLVHYERALADKDKRRSQSKSPPPIPPKRRHVVQYMQIFGGKPPKGDANSDDQRPSSQTDFLKQSTLASYVVLRDNLRHYEEQYRKKTLTFQFGGGSAGNDAIPMPGPTTQSHDFSNLSDLLQLSDLERFRLPTRFEDDDGVEGDCGPQKAITFPERLALQAAPTVLEALDVTDWLVLRAKEGSSAAVEVRGGPKDALIAFATQPSGGSLLYQEAFLTTYRTFVPSVELIRKLIQRYRYFAMSSDQAQKKAARNTFSLLVRVVDDLCAVEMTRELIGHVTSFVYWLIRDGNLTFSRLLRQRLMDRVEEKAGFKRIAPLHDTKPPSTPSHKSASVLELRSAAIAQQMTCLDAELFQKIDPAEMLWWAQEQCDEKSPNLATFTEHFNKVSYWVRTLVVQQPEARDREKYLLKFIKVMKNLRRMGNFNSYLAILSALDSGPVRRLDWSKSAFDQLKEHSSVMDSSHSFRNYRSLLAESRPPCLPYIGLILQDLTFVHVGNSNCLQPAQCQGRSDLLNFGKRWQQFAILDSVRRFKSWHYPMEKDEKIHRVFGGFNHFLSEDETWELSEAIKPRSSGRKSKPA